MFPGCRQTSREAVKLRILVNDGKLSVNATAAQVGIQSSQAVKYLNKVMIEYERRPRIVGTEKEKRLIELLERGASRKIMCQHLAVRSSFIKDYLTRRPGLSSRYHNADQEAENCDVQQAVPR